MTLIALPRSPKTEIPPNHSLHSTARYARTQKRARAGSYTATQSIAFIPSPCPTRQSHKVKSNDLRKQLIFRSHEKRKWSGSWRTAAIGYAIG